MNPETSLTWLPLQSRLKDLRMARLLNKEPPPFWDRIENVAGAGHPDLWWTDRGVSGHIELKHRHALPAHDDTNLALPTITPEQRLWWRQCAEARGRVHVLTRVGNEWFLHEGAWARLHLGLVPAAIVRQNSLLGGTLPNAATLLQLLSYPL